MSAAQLRQAAETLRRVSEPEVCRNRSHESDYWFDRTVCPEPCGMMHNRCNRCLRTVGQECSVEAAEAMPSARDLALADWLERTARLADERDVAFFNSGHPGLTIARLINSGTP